MPYIDQNIRPLDPAIQKAKRGFAALDQGFQADVKEERQAAFQSAIKYLSGALSMSPGLELERDLALSHFMLADLLPEAPERKEHLTTAVELLRNVSDNENPERVGFLARCINELSELEDDHAKKIRLLDEAIELGGPVAQALIDAEGTPVDEVALAWHRIGLFQVRRGRATEGVAAYPFYKVAVECFAKAQELDSGHRHYWYCHGNSLMDKAKATEDLHERQKLLETCFAVHHEGNQLIDADPECAPGGSQEWIVDDFKYNFACVLCLLGRTDDSLSMLREAFQLGHSKEFAREDPDFKAIWNHPEFIKLTAVS